MLQEELQNIDKRASQSLHIVLEMENRTSGIPLKQNWKVRIKNVHEEWNKNRIVYWNARLERECPVFKSCDSCSSKLNDFIICCKNCTKELCAACDSKVHSYSPFHNRTLYKTVEMTATKLLPRQIINEKTLSIVYKGKAIGKANQILCKFLKLFVY